MIVFYFAGVGASNPAFVGEHDGATHQQRMDMAAWRWFIHPAGAGVADARARSSAGSASHLNQLRAGGLRHALGVLFFAEPISGTVVVGALCVLGATLISLQRQAARQAGSIARG